MADSSDKSILNSFFDEDYPQKMERLAKGVRDLALSRREVGRAQAEHLMFLGPDDLLADRVATMDQIKGEDVPRNDEWARVMLPRGVKQA